MRTERSMRRRRRLGIVLVLLGLLPLLAFAAATVCVRITGGGVAYSLDDMRIHRFYAEQVGFAETSPSSRVEVQVYIKQTESISPRSIRMPWYLLREFELSATLERGDTNTRRTLTQSEMSAMLRQHAKLVSDNLSGMFTDKPPEDQRIIAEMAQAGQARRTIATIVWRNVPFDLTYWLRVRWTWIVLVLLIGVGGAMLRTNRAVPSGHCLACRYDLRGTPPGGPCPECGNPRPVETLDSASPSEP